jgi:outer membrane protein TolC
MRASTDRRAGPTALSSILLACLALAGVARAAPLPLAEAQRLAVERDAGREALQNESAAMRDMAVAAGQLPDPEARFGAVNVPVDSWELDRDDMTMLEVGVMQRFPAGRSRRYARERYESGALGADAQARERVRSVRFEVERVWRELDYLDASLGLVAEESRWLEALAGGAEAAYMAGAGESLGLLDARLMSLELEERRLGLQREREALLAELSRWVGEAVDAGRVAGPWRARDLEPVEALLERLQSNPMLESLSHSRDAALREADAARERYRPSFGLDVAYGLRNGAGMDGASRSDMLTAMITFDLPLFTRDRQDREVGAARSRARAAEARRADSARELEARLRATHARALRLGEIVALYERESARLAGVSLEAALAAYRAGEGSLADVVAMHHRMLDLHRREARARADYALALAEIEYLAGEPP